MGQGALQAFKDVLSLGLLVARLRDEQRLSSAKLRWADALDFWQGLRQARVDEFLELTRRLDNKRLSLEQQALLSKDYLWFDESATDPRQMVWLSLPPIEEKVDAWVREKLGGSSACPIRSLCPQVQSRGTEYELPYYFQAPCTETWKGLGFRLLTEMLL